MDLRVNWIMVESVDSAEDKGRLHALSAFYRGQIPPEGGKGSIARREPVEQRDRNAVMELTRQWHWEEISDRNYVYTNTCAEIVEKID
jgi:hypothetical protein